MSELFRPCRAGTLISAGLFLMFCCSREISAQSAQSTKENVRVATIGHEDHGKKTLTAAITRVLSDTGQAKVVSYDEIAKSSEITFQGVKLAATLVEYETKKARYTHVACRSVDDCKKLLSSDGVKLDGVILVVSAADGPMQQTREHIALAHKLGIKSIVVFLNKVDLVDDPEILELVELEIRELLEKNGFKGDTAPIIRGSALKAMALEKARYDVGKSSILKLLEAMDAAFVK